MHTHLASMRSLKLSRCFIGVVAVMCLGAASASAQSIARFNPVTLGPQACCFGWNEQVTYKEPTTPVPVVVTWNTDYEPPSGEWDVGLIVNNGECKTGTYSSKIMPDNADASGNEANGTFQFVVLTNDNVLMPGTNTFELCGGGAGNTSMSLRVQTLTVSKF